MENISTLDGEEEEEKKNRKIEIDLITNSEQKSQLIGWEN